MSATWTADEVSAHRGTLTRPGKDSPFRNRPVAENWTSSRGCAPGNSPDGSADAPGED